MAYIPRPASKRVKPDGTPFVEANKIILAVEKHFEITRVDLFKKCRQIEIVYPRQIAMYLLAHYTVLTIKSIGVIFHKDHSTVVHSIQVIDDYIACNQDVKVQLDAIISTF